MGVVVRRYIDIFTIIINFSYSTCINSFFDRSIPTSLLIFKIFFRSLYITMQQSGNKVPVYIAIQQSGMRSQFK